MTLLRDLAFGAIGYGISELARDDKKVVEKYLDQPIDCIIDDWARQHGMYTKNNDLARTLETLAENYRDHYVY